ncbi:MAG: nicotinate-nucleotide diphosphorylase (carboxylating), partial [Mesorhizobium sp.]
MTSFSPLPATLIEPIVRVALLEDLGRSGDLTTDAVIPYDCTATLVLKARQAGVVAGLDLVSYAFLLVEPAINIQIWRPDGSEVGAGETIARLSGPARG